MPATTREAAPMAKMSRNRADCLEVEQFRSSPLFLGESWQKVAPMRNERDERENEREYQPRSAGDNPLWLAVGLVAATFGLLHLFIA